MTMGTRQLLLPAAPALLLLSLLLASPSWALEMAPQISFQFSLASKVPNDMVRAVVGLTTEAPSLAEAQGQLNEAMAWATDQVGHYPAVSVGIASVGTTPVYQDNVLTGYRAWQNLELTTADFNQLTALIGILQQRIGIQEITFYPSEEALRNAELDMLGQAASEARQRAEKLGTSMGRQHPTMVSLDLNPNYSVIDRTVDLYAGPTLPPGESVVHLQVQAIYKMH